MNSIKLTNIIRLYKRHFKSIEKEEIYKWRAVKCFQDKWDIDSKDFLNMLESSLELSQNLLASGSYFAKRMLVENAREEPETVRSLFIDLFKNDEELLERINSFQENVKSLNNKHFPGKNNYQDLRAVMVYLSLRFPDSYYLFKYEMFKNFIQLVGYPVKIKKGDNSNINYYNQVCDLVKSEIVKDDELIRYHKSRLTEREFNDVSLNLLTQDVIYAAVRHIERFEQNEKQIPASIRLTEVDSKLIPKFDRPVVFKGLFTNYDEKEKEGKRIGNLGELLVFEYEQEKLAKLDINKKAELVSKSKGDGLGYDILSYNENGDEIYIEVKTTTGNISSPFFITKNELERSIQYRKNFFLYRIFDYDDQNNTGKLLRIHGALTDFCVNPILYRAAIDHIDTSEGISQV